MQNCNFYINKKRASNIALHTFQLSIFLLNKTEICKEGTRSLNYH